MSLQELLVEKTCGRPTLYDPACKNIYSNTNAPTNNCWPLHEELQEFPTTTEEVLD